MNPDRITGQRAGWQDIATAPRDGTRILLRVAPRAHLGDATEEVAVGRWRSADEAPKSIPDKWKWQGWSTDLGPFSALASGWMPLPDTEDDITAGLEALSEPIVAEWGEVKDRLGLEESKDRIDYMDNGNLDDVVINNVDMFRLEYMDDNCIWLACYRKPEAGGDVVFWLNARGKITGKQEDD